MRKIGEGGSSIVYLHELDGKKVAIKHFRTLLTKRKTDKIVKKLLLLKHQNLIEFLGYSIEPSTLILEYCSVNIDGESASSVSQVLEIWNEDNKFVFADRLDMIKQATAGLQALHENDIVHKDFKPSNLLVTGTSDRIVVKVSDFDDFYEIKKTVATITRSKVLFGCTLGYTANEICVDMCFPSFSSDIFSWAMTCFEIFSDLTSPWSNVIPIMNDAVFIKCLSEGKRPMISDMEKNYTNVNGINELSCLVSKCWDQMPSNRPTVQKVFIHSSL